MSEVRLHFISGGHRSKITYGVILLTLWAISFGWLHQATAASLSVRELRLANASPSVATQYLFNVGYVTAASVGSVRFQVCDDPFLGTPCVAPAGLDLSGATLLAQTGNTGFSIHGSSTANVLVLTRSPSVVSPGTSSYEFDQMVNPTNTGSYYVRMEVFASTDASGSAVDGGALAFNINRDIVVSTEVPPYLEFCAGVTIGGFDCGTATGSNISFGELSKTEPRTGTSQFMATTNAASGYGVTLIGTTMTAGNQIISAMNGAASDPGTSQFGFNLRANVDPVVGQEPVGTGSAAVTAGYNQPNQYRFANGDLLVSAPGANDYQKFTSSYIVNIPADQPPGQYVTTLSYVCLANF